MPDSPATRWQQTRPIRRVSCHQLCHPLVRTRQFMHLWKVQTYGQIKIAATRKNERSKTRTPSAKRVGRRPRRPDLNPKRRQRGRGQQQAADSLLLVAAKSQNHNEGKAMSTQTRTITRGQLEEWGLPHDLAEEQDAAKWPGIAVEIHREQTGTRRWYSRHLLVFKAPDDGQLWGVTYNQGLTEVQEDTDPWDDAAEVTAHRMERYEKTVTAWRKAEAGQ